MKSKTTRLSMMDASRRQEVVFAFDWAIRERVIAGLPRPLAIFAAAEALPRLYSEYLIAIGA